MRLLRLLRLFDALHRHVSDRKVVDLTATVAAYDRVSRCLEAQHIEAEAKVQAG